MSAQSRLSKLVRHQDRVSKVGPRPPDPTFDQLKSINEPDSILGVYRSRNRGALLLGFLFLVGSLAFVLLMPPLVGYLVEAMRQHEAAEITQAEFIDKRTDALKYLGIIGGVSLACEFISSHLFRVASSRLAKEIRYDTYHCYFRKCAQIAKGQKELDVDQSMRFFQFKKVNEDIDVLATHLQYYVPLRIKSALCTLGSLVFLFIVSWQLTLVALGGLMVAGLILLCN